MSEEKSQAPEGVQRIDPAQSQNLAKVGLAILAHDACVVPKKAAAFVGQLEQVLAGLASGQLQIVTSPKDQEEQPAKTTKKRATKKRATSKG